MRTVYAVLLVVCIVLGLVCVALPASAQRTGGSFGGSAWGNRGTSTATSSPRTTPTVRPASVVRPPTPVQVRPRGSLVPRAGVVPTVNRVQAPAPAPSPYRIGRSLRPDRRSAWGSSSTSPVRVSEPSSDWHPPPHTRTDGCDSRPGGSVGVKDALETGFQFFGLIFVAALLLRAR